MLRISLAVILLSAGVPAASGPSAISATPVPEATAIKLDGEFTETEWESVPAISDFRRREPKDGEAPAFKTDFKVVSDAANICLAVLAHDPEPPRIIGLRTRRDSN